MPAQWQIRFDGGHQQRYLPDREAVLRYVLAVGLKAASPRFELFRESQPIVLRDGTAGGRAFSLVEIIDLARPGEIERLRAELSAAGQPGAGSPDTGSAAAGSPGAGSPGAGAAEAGAAGAGARHAATGRAVMTAGGKGPEPGSRTIIPLMPGVARPRGERRALMREAVVEVIGHLVLKAVPEGQRSPLFDQARDLLAEAGWGLGELFEAAHDGSARRDLFRALGLEE